MKKKIRIIRKKPGCMAEWIDLPNKLEDLQREVGGYIEILPLTDGSCLICGKPFESIQRNAKFCKDCQQKGTKQETGESPRPTDADQSGKPADYWAMPEAYDFWHDAFRWKMGFIEFVEAMKGLGITVDGLERDNGKV